MGSCGLKLMVESGGMRYDGNGGLKLIIEG